jgi:hypothetical protein
VIKLENVLFIERESGSDESLDSKAFDTVALVPSQFFIFVPEIVGGKMVSWLVSDPDEEEPKFNKDFTLAFEFKNLEHAIRARDAVMLEGHDCHLLGDIYV